MPRNAIPSPSCVPARRENSTHRRRVPQLPASFWPTSKTPANEKRSPLKNRPMVSSVRAFAQLLTPSEARAHPSSARRDLRRHPCDHTGRVVQRQSTLHQTPQVLLPSLSPSSPLRLQLRGSREVPDPVRVIKNDRAVASRMIAARLPVCRRVSIPLHADS